MSKSIRLLWVFSVTLTLLCGCRVTRRIFHRQHGSSSSDIVIHLLKTDTEPLPGDVQSIERQWSSPRRRHGWNTSHGLDLLLRVADKMHFSTRISGTAQDATELEWTRPDPSGELATLVFENSLGIVTFSGQIDSSDSSSAPSSGTVVTQIHRSEVATLENAFDEKLSLATLLPLICKKVSLDKMLTYAECDVTFNVEQARQLAEYDFDASHINQLTDKGYAFTAEDFVDLGRRHVPYSYIVDWKQYDEKLSADQLIYAKERHLDADMARQWRDAGYDLTVEKVYWVKSRHLDPADAVKWKEAGYTLDLDQLYWIKGRHMRPSSAIEWEQAGYSLDLEELYWVKGRHVDPAEARNWKQVGYDLDLEQLYWAKSRHLSTKEAGQWKNAGYKLDLKQLYRLNQYHVDSSYAQALADPAYEQLTVDELIDFKQSNISPETIKKLRRQKK